MTMKTDANAMRAKLRSIAKQLPQRTAAAMKAEADADMDEMQRRVPVATGTLRDSGQVGEPEQHGHTISVPSSFGAPGSGAEDYAVPVHEHLDVVHPNGQAKFLESVLNESRSTMLERVGRRVAFKNWK